jgi:hypothetical protein
MTDKVSLEQVFPLSLVGFPLPVTIPPLFHIHLSLLREVCSSPDKAEYYHIIIVELLSDPIFGRLQSEESFFLPSVLSFFQSFVFGF